MIWYKQRSPNKTSTFNYFYRWNWEKNQSFLFTLGYIYHDTSQKKWNKKVIWEIYWNLINKKRYYKVKVLRHHDLIVMSITDNYIAKNKNHYSIYFYVLISNLNSLFLDLNYFKHLLCLPCISGIVINNNLCPQESK